MPRKRFADKGECLIARCPRQCIDQGKINLVEAPLKIGDDIEVIGGRIKHKPITVGTARQAILAAATVQHIIAAVAKQSIRARPANQRVIPGQPAQLVVTIAAVERVTQPPSGEGICDGIAGQHIGSREGTHHVFKTAERAVGRYAGLIGTAEHVVSQRTERTEIKRIDAISARNGLRGRTRNKPVIAVKKTDGARNGATTIVKRIVALAQGDEQIFDNAAAIVEAVITSTHVHRARHRAAPVIKHIVGCREKKWPFSGQIIKRHVGQPAVDLLPGSAFFRPPKQSLLRGGKKSRLAGQDPLALPFKLVGRAKIFLPLLSAVIAASFLAEFGAEVIKIFPGSVLGPGFVSSVMPVVPGLQLMPTGGVEPTQANLSAWFKAGVVCVGMGSQLFTKEIIAQKNWTELQDSISKAMAIIADLRKPSI